MAATIMIAILTSLVVALGALGSKVSDNASGGRLRSRVFRRSIHGHPRPLFFTLV